MRCRPSFVIAAFFVVALSLVGPSAVVAFSPEVRPLRPLARSQAASKKIASWGASSIARTDTVIFAAKKPKGGGPEEGEKKQVVDPLELFILFMTPWRNPNSIFIYMLLIINILGRMQESQ